MKAPLEWLKQYIDVGMSADELAEIMTNTGTAVDSIEYPGREVNGVVVGKIGAVRAHPQAFKLAICEVDWGEGARDIACGAPNVREGIKVAVAKPGSVLPGGRSIREASIKGVVSHGMLLSGDELGLNDDAAGILELEDGLPLGGDLSEIFGMGEAVLDLEITPNRPDCLCILGIAREIAALTGAALRLPEIRLDEKDEPVDSCLSVEILDPDLCTRYVARVIEGVNITPAPLWMQRRLKLSGVRPISNIVDITNYVMLETGQPLHAFDADKVHDGKVIVRRATDGEEIVTLDGSCRRLHPSTLLICDPQRAIALAGVMGGENTEVSKETSRVILESAHFSPLSISRTAREQELPSEASYRFERGVDPAGCVRAADRAAGLMQEHGSGKMRRGAIDVLPSPIVPVYLDLRLQRAERLLGVELEMPWVIETMRRLGLEVVEEKGPEGVVGLKVPTYRPDLEREVDLVEEIARIYGYNRVASTLPASRYRHGGLNSDQRSERRLRDLLTGLGLFEVITYAFVSAERNALFASREQAEALQLANPLSEEAGEMRTSLYPGLVGTLLYNHNRHQKDLGIFETGKVFHPLKGERLPREDLMLGIALMGDWTPRQWDSPAVPEDFFTLKSIWENLLEGFSLGDNRMDPKRAEHFHPSLVADLVVQGRTVGEMGMLNPLMLKRLGLPEGVTALQVDLGALFAVPCGNRLYREVPRFPAIQMDLSLVVNEEVKVENMVDVIRENGGELLKDVSLFDLYRGDQIAYGEKSLTFNLSFYDVGRTLKDEEAKQCFAVIVEALKRELRAVVRE